MTRRIGIIAVLMAAVGAPAAMADVFTDYTINFTGTGTLPTAGSFTYDQTTPQFSAFLVNWDGLTFDLTSIANSPFTNTGAPSCTGTPDAEASFDLLSGDCQSPPPGYEVGWDANASTGGSGFEFSVLNDNPPFDSFTLVTFAGPLASGFVSGKGSFTITAVVPSAVPEPCSAVLLATLLLGAFVARERIGQRIRSRTTRMNS